jgi:outer membrane protein assembly factor BamB
MLAIDWAAGQVTWAFHDPEREFPILASAAATDQFVIVGGRDKRVRSFDALTGNVRWTFAAQARIDSSPVIVGGHVFVGSSDGNVYVLDVASGKELWRFETGAPITSSPAVAAGRLVIGNEDGVLYCLGAVRDGEP